MIKSIPLDAAGQRTGAKGGFHGNGCPIKFWEVLHTSRKIDTVSLSTALQGFGNSVSKPDFGYHTDQIVDAYTAV
jgi:hypothetical protein